MVERQNIMTLNHNNSPYTWYKESAVGNPDIHWETVRKFNLGIDYSFLSGLFAGSVEVFLIAVQIFLFVVLTVQFLRSLELSSYG